MLTEGGSQKLKWNSPLVNNLKPAMLTANTSVNDIGVNKAADERASEHDSAFRLHTVFLCLSLVVIFYPYGKDTLQI